MPVVPFSKSPSPAGPQGSLPRDLPDEPWALMAAAQMHIEGRLVAPAEKAKPDERPR